MLLILILSSCIILLNSCEREEFIFEETENYFEDTKLESVAINKNDWKEQLNYLVDNDIPFLKDNGIKLLGYKAVTAINSKRKRHTAKFEILQEDSYVPVYTEEVNKIFLTPIRDIPIKYKTQFTFENLKYYLSNKIDNSDLKKIVLNWQYKGSKFSSICLVSDREGIVYDNIITNIIIVETKPEVIFTPVRLKKSTIRLKSANIEEDTPIPDGPISYSRTYSKTAYWLWGYERGRVTISIEVRGQVINGIKHINSHSENASSYITLGKGESVVTLNSFVKGSSGQCDIAWAWYLATPLVTIDISFLAGSYTVDVGFGFGSRLYGSGRENVSPYDLN